MKKILLFAFALVVFTACGDDGGGDGGGDKQIVLSGQSEKNQQVYADDEASAGFSFTAKSSWTATVAETVPAQAALSVANDLAAGMRSSGVEWLRLLSGGLEKYSGGAGEFDIAIELTPNYTGSSRSAKIAIASTSGGTGITITVMQQGVTADGEVPQEPEDPDNSVKVASITLNETAVSVAPGRTFQLSVTEVLPANATDNSVTWSCIPTSVATVDGDGLVTVAADAADGAAATVTATSNDGSGTNISCVVTVAHVKVASITFNANAKFRAPCSTLQLTAAVLPADATDKSVMWSCVPASVATVDENGLVTVAANAAYGATATITARANDGSDKDFSHSITVNGVSIKGVTWATCNVAAPGTFAARPEDPGMFYQWNRITAWPVTGAVTDWDTSTATGDTWAAANDPCPDGWCVPDEVKQRTLCGYIDVWTSSNGVNGYRFTDEISGGSIFLPAAGYRDKVDGRLIGSGSDDGNYWAGTAWSPTWTFYLRFPVRIPLQDGIGSRAYGFSVRCVAE